MDNYDFTETEDYFNKIIEPTELANDVKKIICEYSKLALFADDGCGEMHANNIITLEMVVNMLDTITKVQQTKS